jgi:hypothetical protein
MTRRDEHEGVGSPRLAASEASQPLLSSRRREARRAGPSNEARRVSVPLNSLASRRATRRVATVQYKRQM